MRLLLCSLCGGVGRGRRGLACLRCWRWRCRWLPVAGAVRLVPCIAYVWGVVFWGGVGGRGWWRLGLAPHFLRYFFDVRAGAVRAWRGRACPRPRSFPLRRAGGLAKALQGELAIKIPIRQGIQDSEFLIQEISNEVLWQRRSGE